ncbi:MAG: hypothetical protein O6939_06895 [Bacteroidetes bacterium]|nr:hypothetical protein [Bacteroidota bacterium]
MKFKELLGMFKESASVSKSPNHLKSHMKNLLEIALVDEHFDETEMDLLKKLAQKYNISEDELGKIQDNPSTIEFQIPEDDNEKFEQFYELVNMMTIDGKILDEEMNLCVLIGKKFEYNNVRDVIDTLIQDIKTGLPMENTRNSVDWLLH